MLVEGNIQAQGECFLWAKSPSVHTVWMQTFHDLRCFTRVEIFKMILLLLPIPSALRGEQVCCPFGWKAKTAEILFCSTSQHCATKDTALGIGGFDNHQKCQIPGSSSIVPTGSGVAASFDPESFIHTGSTAQPMVFEKPKRTKYLLSRQMLPKSLGASTRTASWIRKQSAYRIFNELIRL